METPVYDELEEGESGILTYQFYFRGIIVGKKEFRLPAGSAYPSYEEYIPKGYVVTSGELPAGTVHLKNEVVEIAVERDPNTSIEAIEINGQRTAPIYYDLQGRRHSRPTKGLYIKNGKKVVIK